MAREARDGSWIDTDWNGQGHVFLLDGRVWMTEIEGLRPLEKKRKRKPDTEEGSIYEIRRVSIPYEEFLQRVERSGAIISKRTD